MQKDTARFRGNPRHLSLLTDAVEKGEISGWNSFVRKNGASFRARLAGADLSGLSLSEVRLDGADLTDADLSDCLLVRANLNQARIRGSNLAGADLTSARLVHADLTNANLRGADMNHVKARGAVLSGADLTGANLDGADLSKASLKGAALTGSSRSGAKMKVRVKVRTTSKEHEADEKYSPWLKALDEESRLKEFRRIQEEKKAIAERERLDRKLGRRKPLFNRVK
jgi:hypothetical protein